MYGKLYEWKSVLSGHDAVSYTHLDVYKRQHLDWLKEFDGFDTIHFTKEINGTSNEIELGTVTGKIFYDKNKVHPEVEAWDYLHRLASQYEGVTAKKCISGPNMILIDHFLQLGNKETPYYEREDVYKRQV